MSWGSAAAKYAVFVLVTLALGAFAGAFTWTFFFLMNLGIDLLWSAAPAALDAAGLPAVAYPLAFCALGGVVIGLFQKRFGPYPTDMNTVLAQVKATGRYEYRSIGASFTGALLPLLFGGSIGPEAGLTGVIAGLCTWVGDRMRFLGRELRDVTAAGTAAAVSAIFSAPLFGLVAPLAGRADDSNGSPAQPVELTVPKARKVAAYLLAIAGALGAFALCGMLAGGSGGLPHFSSIAIGPRELAWGVPIALVGALAGWLFHAAGAGTRAVAGRLGDRPVAKAALAGALLGVCGIALPFALFAGEAQTEQLAAVWTGMGAAVLMATGFAKVVATQLCLGLGWRGGHFFPLIFSGIAIGYGCAALTGIDPVFALCACTAALLGAVMRQPIMTALLLFLCFPVKAAFVLLAAAALGSLVPVPARWMSAHGKAAPGGGGDASGGSGGAGGDAVRAAAGSAAEGPKAGDGSAMGSAPAAR